MSQTVSATGTSTYSAVDVENVFRRFRADILMIADSSGAITRQKAEDYAHDAEYLAVRKFLKKIDVTLMVGEQEKRALQYNVNEAAGGIDTSRPGGVMWPRLQGGWIRIIFTHTAAYTPEAEQAAGSKLKVNWISSSTSTQHVSLTASGGRDYTSNAFGLQRKDFQ
jgi:hypothetical protein